AGTLQIQGGTTISSEPLTLAGPGFNGIGALDSPSDQNTWDTPIILAGAASVGADSGSILTIDPTLKESATGSNLTKVGTSTVAFTGTTSNTYTGTTFVNDGTLQFNKSAGALALTGNLVVGDSPEVDATSDIDLAQLEGSNQLSLSSAVTV